MSVVAVIAAILIVNAPALHDLWRVLQLPRVGNASDAATHYLRMLHARDLYLASGHHWGWDPFWFQGYVPFLLYPHLTYVLLALLSIVIPVNPARIFNAYTVALYFALPLVAALPLLRSRGAAAAVVVAAWLVDMSTPYGGGLRGVFHMGLLSQQAGLCLFAALAYDLIVARRIDRAALWLGLIPLVHVHTSVLAGIAWLVEGLWAATHRRAVSRPLAVWIRGTTIALLISLPTALGLLHGWSRVGPATTFPVVPDLLAALLRGGLIAPWQTVAAIGLGVVAGAIWSSRTERGRYLLWFGVGLFYVAVSLQEWELGIAVVDRVLDTMLRLRSLPFAFVWMAILAASVWPCLPRVARSGLALLTIAGVVMAWPLQALHAQRIGSPWQNGERRISPVVYNYYAALDWIAADVGSDTASIAICVPPRTRRGLPLLAALEHVGLPLLGGHGIELTPVHNARFTSRTLTTTCETIRRQIRDYAVGYIVGATVAQRDRFQTCLERGPSFEQGAWWVFATNVRWRTIGSTTFGFLHNRTWTELQWHLRASPDDVPLRLPIANTAPWSATVDGRDVPIATTKDGMMTVTVPAGGRRLQLRYRGYTGEWTAVIISLSALAIGFVRVRRRTRTEPA